jgi:hypothetical protein
VVAVSLGYKSKFPGATLGACTTVPQQACTTWILSGGPNPTDPIGVDDNLLIWIAGGKVIVQDGDNMAKPVPAVPFEAQVGDGMWVHASDAGGCRSLSPLWLHCAATGQKKQLFPGWSSTGCNHSPGLFIKQHFYIEL